MKYTLFFGIVTFFVLCIYRMFATSTEDHTLADILAKNPLVLDVRTPEEFSKGHLEGSVNVPLAELENGAQLTLDHKRPILTCCSHGVRSIRAAKLLQMKGYKNAVDGGAWTNLQIIRDKHPVAATAVEQK
jgi:phage shock protein E